MQMQSIRGKNIVSAGYDPVDGILAVQFSKSGTYRFKGVPEKIWVSIQRHPFPDKYFSQVVKGKFPAEKPEKVSNEQSGNEQQGNAGSHSQREGVPIRDVQNTAGRNGDGGAGLCPAGDVPEGRRVAARGHERGSSLLLQGGGSNAQSAGGRVVEFFRKEDGLTFEEQGHVYKFEGKRVMSLTQILDAAGLVDYSMVQPAVLEAKRILGGKVHEYCLWNDQGELDMDDLKPWPKYWNRVEGWRQFVADSGFMPDLTWCEVPAAARVNGMLYALTVDRYGVVGDGENIANAVIEIKTCADKEPSHQIQTAGQAILFRPQSDAVQLQLKRFAVYLLDKANGAGKFYTVEEHTNRSDEKVFIAALMLTQYRIQNQV